jgi:hypothetical protein
MGPTAKFHLAEIMTTLFVSSIISAYLQAQRQILALGFPKLIFSIPSFLHFAKGTYKKDLLYHVQQH